MLLHEICFFVLQSNSVTHFALIPRRTVVCSLVLHLVQIEHKSGCAVEFTSDRVVSVPPPPPWQLHSSLQSAPPPPPPAVTASVPSTSCTADRPPPPVGENPLVSGALR